MTANPKKPISSPALKVARAKISKGKEPLVCLTAYTTPMAKLVDKHCDLVLVGDSLGMVLYGMSSTIGVTLDMMIMHGKAVRKGLKNALMVIDMPFGSYEDSNDQAYYNAKRLMEETGADAVKIEGGKEMAVTTEFITSHGIPVISHIGLTAQSVKTFGGFKVQGRGKQAEMIMEAAHAVAEAGALAVLIEMVPEPLARKITDALDVPTIGIGASNACDGQILVTDDMLGLFTDFKPKFVKRYAELEQIADEALGEFAKDVKSRKFPGKENFFEDKPKPAKK